MSIKPLTARTQSETMDLLELLADITHPTGRNDYAHMLESIASVGTQHGGYVSMNDLRVCVRGHIDPPRIGALVATCKGKKRAIIVNAGHDIRQGSYSGDNGRPQIRYALGNFANWCTEYARAANHGDDAAWARAYAIEQGWAAEGWNSEDNLCTDWKVYLQD